MKQPEEYLDQENKLNELIKKVQLETIEETINAVLDIEHLEIFIVKSDVLNVKEELINKVLK